MNKDISKPKQECGKPFKYQNPFRTKKGKLRSWKAVERLTKKAAQGY